ncbi:MAG: hypothetical protein JNM56_21170, partial [Planctomycetia bacterium]|nr:hypothetical protein [Planctomycetia bacterium]
PLTAAILAGLLLLNFVAFATTYAKYRDAERRLALAATDHSQVGQTAEAAQQQAAQAEARRAQAEQALNEARAAEQKLRTEWQQVQTREKQAREDAQKAQEQTKLARQDEAAAREEAKKAQDAATQARLALTQAAPAADRQLAEHWEKAGQWTAAAYHLSRLIESQPQDEKLLLRRADARRRLEQWLPAASDYARALELKPDSGCADLRDRCLLRSGPVQAAAVVGLLAGPWPTVILYDPSIP